MVVSTQTYTQTQNEMKKYAGKRKHRSQMTPREVNGLWYRLRNVRASQWKMSSHALDRLHQKEIEATLEDIVSTIHNATLIEYKIDERRGQCDERVVLRANAVVNREYNLNAVYSLTNNRIVSVWINHVNDLHKTLNWSIYDENMKVFGV